MDIKILQKHLKNAYKKYKTHQVRSLQLINQVLSILSKMSLANEKKLYSASLLENFDSLPDRLTFKLYQQLNSLIPDLIKIVNEFEKITLEIEEIRRKFSRELKEIYRLKANYINSSLEILEEFEQSLNEVVDMFLTELILRKQILSELENYNKLKPAQMSLYVSIWMNEVYIEKEKFFYLLEEFNEIERILETPYNSFQEVETQDSNSAKLQ